MAENRMDKIVALAKRRGFMFQSSEIYGGLNGFWDYGPLGVELKRNVRNAWWSDMITEHDELSTPAGAPEAFDMVGVETSIIMHPQVWKCSGHFDLFCDKMVDCKEKKSRYRLDHVKGRWIEGKLGDAATEKVPLFVTAVADGPELDEALTKRALKLFDMRSNQADRLVWSSEAASLATIPFDQYGSVVAPEATVAGTLTAPRDFNLMFKTTLGALGTEADTAYLRPETAQGMFVNFKNVCDSSRVKLPFGIAQIGKSFRNEITPRNFTFRSREFEQMEMEFFCHPSQSLAWYQYWRDRRYNWYVNLGIPKEHLILREHAKDELSHYSVGTADVEYAFPFLGEGEYGELEGVAHRGDFDLRSHMEGKLAKQDGQLVVEKGPDGKPKYQGSGKDLSYFDDQTRERFVPHVIEPAAGCDRATLAFLCEAYHEDQQPDEKGAMQERVMLKLHPRLAPIKVAVFPLIKKDGMPEKATAIYRDFKRAGIAVAYDQQAAIGRRYRRMDEIGTPFCVTVDGETLTADTVTVRNRDTLVQDRVPVKELVGYVQERLRGSNT
ncbi:MAG TPA: glycine--tRNA ligase [Planctomycetaceae bacterium]|nr:glycine--tRNA ligase [Planctomycetaceae bacterium]